MLGKQFQKMRRRLTVTGASQNIDGVAKVGQQESQEGIKKPKKKDKVRKSSHKKHIDCIWKNSADCGLSAICNY